MTTPLESDSHFTSPSPAARPSRLPLWIAAGVMILAPGWIAAQQFGAQIPGMVQIDRPNYLFRDLEIGQPVRLTERPEGYTLHLLEGDHPEVAERILDYSWDHVVVGDGKTTTGIPVTSIRSMTRADRGVHARVKTWYDERHAAGAAKDASETKPDEPPPAGKQPLEEESPRILPPSGKSKTVEPSTKAETPSPKAAQP